MVTSDRDRTARPLFNGSFWGSKQGRGPYSDDLREHMIAAVEAGASRREADQEATERAKGIMDAAGYR